MGTDRTSSGLYCNEFSIDMNSVQSLFLQKFIPFLKTGNRIIHSSIDLAGLDMSTSLTC